MNYKCSGRKKLLEFLLQLSCRVHALYVYACMYIYNILCYIHTQYVTIYIFINTFACKYNNRWRCIHTVCIYVHARKYIEIYIYTFSFPLDSYLRYQEGFWASSGSLLEVQNKLILKGTCESKCISKRETKYCTSLYLKRAL